MTFLLLLRFCVLAGLFALGAWLLTSAAIGRE
jgi:hypothetical protein